MAKQKNEQIVYQEENKPKNKSIFGWVFLLILLLLSFSLAVFSWYKTKNVSKPAPVSQNNQQKNSIDETANWKTYRNEEYGFEVKYPKNYEPIEKIVGGVSFGRLCDIAILGPQELDLSEYVNKNFIPADDSKLLYKTISKENVLVAGIEAIKFEGEMIGSMSGSWRYGINVFLLKDKKIYNFSYSPGVIKEEIDSNEVKIFDQILSTFKFIDQKSIDTSDWKTYRNEEYGFEVKYPENYFAEAEKQNIFIKNNQNNGLYSIIIIDNPLDLNSSDYVENLKKNQNSPEAPNILSSKKITVNEIEGIDTELIGAGGFQVRSVYFKIKNKIINIQYGLNVLATDFNNDQIVYNKYLQNGNYILSTFKFIDQENVDTSEWKTYRNEEYGFELKYPKNFLIKENNTKFQSCFLLSEPYQCSSGLMNGVFELSFRNKEGKFSSYCGAAPSETENVIEIQFSVLENSNNFTIDNIANKCEHIFQGDTPQKDCFFYDKTIDGYEAVDVRINGIGGNLPAIYIVKGDKIYLTSMSYSCDLNDALADDIFNQLLFTFKFIE